MSCRIFLAALALTAACSQVPAPENGGGANGGGGTAVAFETILQRSIPGQSGPSRREVLRDPEAWRAAWASLREGSDLSAEPPAVDFSRQMVILAAMEMQSCVSKVTIRSVTRADGALAVDVLEAPPAPNCVCITAERPIHIIRLEKVDLPPRFDVERGVTSCG